MSHTDSGGGAGGFFMRWSLMARVNLCVCVCVCFYHGLPVKPVGCVPWAKSMVYCFDVITVDEVGDKA